MPYKDPEKARQRNREYYQRMKDIHWKDEEGNWKKPKSYYDPEKQELRRKKNREYYHANREYYLNKNKEKRKQARVRGICPICRKDKRLVWDHNHKTGAYRDHICHNCNLALGHGKEDPEIFKNLVEYVRKHNKN